MLLWLIFFFLGWLSWIETIVRYDQIVLIISIREVRLFIQLINLLPLLFFFVLFLFSNIIRILSKNTYRLIRLLDKRNLSQYPCFELTLFFIVSTCFDVSNLEPVILK